MIIKNNNKAVDVQKNHHVCWEVRKSSIRGYAKTVISYGSWSAHKDPQTIPSISWEGGTTISSKCWIERIKLTRIGFDTYTVTDKKYLIPSFNIDSDCTVNHTGNNADGFTVTFGRYTNTTSDRTFTGSIQQEGCTITVTVTQTKRDIVTVTWSLQGGNISGSTSNKTETVGYGDTVSFGKYAPSKTGYTFAGWSTSSDASSGSTSGTYTITADTNFYAIWSANKYTVIWDANGGTLNGDSNKQEIVTHGSSVSFTTYIPTREGYTFVGWNTDRTATTGSTSGNSSAITADTTFYATWKSATLTPILLILAHDAPQTKPKPVIGSILYSTNDNKLTLDAQTNGANNTPIAICVIPDVYENLKNGDESDGGVHTARFVSLNYMNYNTPATGSIGTQTMYFGNNGTTIGNTKGGTDKTSCVGGKWNTKRCVFKATNQDKTSDKVDNNPGEGYCAPACCCDRYSTPGTKQGDWYLPMPGELYQLANNKTVINEKRTALVGSGFSEGYSYWSSREYSSDYEYLVYLNGGSINYGDKSGYSYVLGFLALEV